jgi:hypothetical protein
LKEEQEARAIARMDIIGAVFLIKNKRRMKEFLHPPKNSDLNQINTI